MSFQRAVICAETGHNEICKICSANSQRANGCNQAYRWSPMHMHLRIRAGAAVPAAGVPCAAHWGVLCMRPASPDQRRRSADVCRSERQSARRLVYPCPKYLPRLAAPESVYPLDRSLSIPWAGVCPSPGPESVHPLVWWRSLSIPWSGGRRRPPPGARR